MKRADFQLVLLWGLTAALGAAFVRAELIREGVGAAVLPPASAPAPADVPPAVPTDIVAPLPGAKKAAPASPYAVGGHRKIDAAEVRRLIRAGELSDREAMDYGGAE